MHVYQRFHQENTDEYAAVLLLLCGDVCCSNCASFCPSTASCLEHCPRVLVLNLSAVDNEKVCAQRDACSKLHINLEYLYSLFVTHVKFSSYDIYAHMFVFGIGIVIL